MKNQKTTISYSVESYFWKRDIGSKIEALVKGVDFNQYIQQSKKIFSDNEPIIARNKAFNHFQSLVDVLYEGIGKKYVNDKQARIDLQKYFNSGNDFELGSGSYKFKASDDFFKGIIINMIIETNSIQKIIQIHSINYVDYLHRPDDEITHSLNGLVLELKYYNAMNFRFGNLSMHIHLNNIGGKTQEIIETPFDWEDYTQTHKGKKLIM